LFSFVDGYLSLIIISKRLLKYMSPNDNGMS